MLCGNGQCHSDGITGKKFNRKEPNYEHVGRDYPRKLEEYLEAIPMGISPVSRRYEEYIL